MRTITNKKIRLTLIVLLCFIAIPIIGFLILSWAILPPQKLTPMVVEIANKRMDAELTCDRIELTYFETFPHLGITLTNGKIISRVAQNLQDSLVLPKMDSLLSFQKCVVSFRPMDLLLNNKISINEISIDHPVINGYINKEGKANWDIISASNTQTEEEASDTSSLPVIDLKQVRIQNGNLTYYDRSREMYTHIDSFFFSINGALTQQANVLDIEAGWKSFQFLSYDYSLENHLELHLDTKLKLSDHYNRITFSDTEFFINKLPFTLSGYVFNDAENKKLDIDIDYGLKVPDLNSLLAFMPSAYIKKGTDVKATGTIDLSGSIKGHLGDSIYPVFSACCKLENGSLHGKDKAHGVDSLALDMDLYLDMANSDSSYIDLPLMLLKGKNLTFNLTGKATDILNNPNVSASLKGDINFTELSKSFISEDTLSMEGNINVDLETRFKANDILQANYGKIFARGQANINNFKAVSKPFDINMAVTQADMKLSSEKKEGKTRNKEEVLAGSLSIDSLNIKWKDEVITLLSNLQASFETPSSIDTTAVIPIAGKISFNRLRTLLPDSVWLWAGKTEITGNIKPSSGNKKTPEGTSVISIDSLAYIYPLYKSALLLTKSEFNIKAFPYQIDTIGFTKRRAQMAARKDSTFKQMQFKQDSSIMLTGSSSLLLKNWEVKGNVVFNNLKASTPLFPVQIQMNGTNVQFSTNDIKLSGANLKLGGSDLTLSGEIQNLRRALLRGGKLTAELNVNSEYINCNELMNAISSGMQYNEQREMDIAVNSAATSADKFISFKDATTAIDTIQQASADDSGVFVLPSFLDVKLQTNAKRIDFNDLKAEDVKGEIVLHNQSLQLTDLMMNSNMGQGSLTMVYKATGKDKASAGFDIKLDEMQINKLIDLYPSVDTLMPMLRSFEGVVSCQMAATCDLDSTMSIVLPSLYSACYLNGKNMVLLDGETFAEISKTLMFKNKKKNIIDNISVELIVQDNKIEVFPFLIEIDRYRVAVGGTHNLDMTFNYHISVLKSPVPFKLGIDVTGNMDDFKYKITKCKYKDIFTPAKSTQLDSTTINVRKNIYDAIHKRIYTALYTPQRTDSTRIHITHTEIASNDMATKNETDSTKIESGE